MANANEIPTKAEKVLFAVDVVNFFLNARYPQLSAEFKKREIADIAGSHREFIHQRFNENIKRMIATIDDTQSVLVRRDFLEMKNQDEVNAASLVEYNSTYRNTYFSSGFQAKSFLMYCARVALMACYFFSNGMGDVLDIAVDLIVSDFPDDQNLSCSVWDSLNEAAVEHAAAESLAFKSPVSTWRETREIVSSETEDSTSSTINSESDSAAETQNVPIISEPLCAESLTGEMRMLDVSKVEPSDIGSSTKSNVSTQTDESRGFPDNRSLVSLSNRGISAKDPSPSGGFLIVESTPERLSRHTDDKSPSYKSPLGKRASPRKDREEESDIDEAGKLEAVSTRVISPSGVKKQRLGETKKSDQPT